MVHHNPETRLPTSAELPCSDDTPVDNEDQNFIPNFLLFLLEFVWGNRLDWYFGVDMGIYHTTGVNPRVPVVPDGFLSLGVERRKTMVRALV
jgi:Uma2 family endonuclease